MLDSLFNRGTGRGTDGRKVNLDVPAVLAAHEKFLNGDEEGVVADDAPDEQAGGGEIGVEATLLPVFEEKILAAVAADEDFEAFGFAAFDGRCVRVERSHSGDGERHDRAEYRLLRSAGQL